ncbi:Lovastatin diketide synthase LovF [Madurella mycetomatis]|uniref:Lovastatin diketide synthase LovF n=1 Tax=Madurella mycetomatis TaxID=100816 RepID=A0A175VXF2_9PEZI|nr:Lovastatin diketide synthase LovF [Madurella mycetomatis]
MAPYYLSGSEGQSTPVGCASDSTQSDCPSPPRSFSTSPPSVGGEKSKDIAIVGFSFDFPAANSEEAFWDLVMQGKRAVSPFPPSRFHHSRFRETIRPQKASFVQRDISAFDARFFGVTEDEALATDPQLRILLETTYRALENAGIPMEKVSGTDTSVYTGCFTADYLLATSRDPENAPRYSSTGMAQSMLSNRISAFFNLTGPSITIDTACSSSLVALDMACRSIRQGESSVGIVAGCNLLLTPDLFISLSSLGFLSPDGVCHSFDSRANGYSRGEGFGVLIVKALDTALADGDTIRAVIRATATNQNGRTNLALPSKEMQRRLIEETYRKAHLNMSHTRFFEAHGTGTAAGDPLEAMAIGNAFAPGRDSDDPIVVGAVKANIGHLEGAAGIAGVIKTVLALEKGIIPPIAGLMELNPEIDAEFLKLKFPKVAMSWPSTGLRRASINSFGFGGTNSHAVLDDAFHYLQSRGLRGQHRTTMFPSLDCDTRLRVPLIAPQDFPTTPGTPKLIVWSANEPNTLTRMLESYREHFEIQSKTELLPLYNLGALAYTLAQKRSLLQYRAYAVSNTVPELLQQFQTPVETFQSGADPKVGFIFTGQGAQWRGMSRELFEFPGFRDSVFNADKFFHKIGCNWRPSEILENINHQPSINIHDPCFSQPLCTILQIAIVDLLTALGIHPTTVIGHSSGEIAAAYAVGAICKESAWKLAYFRGHLSSQLVEWSDTARSPRGSMMAVALSEASVLPYITKTLESLRSNGVLAVACINSPQSVTVSGDEDLIQELQTVLNADGIFARVLKVPVAYHSPHMETIASSYKQCIGNLNPGGKPPHHATMISSVSADAIDHKELQQAEYWVRNMVSPVRFSPAVERLCRTAARKTKKKLDLSHRQFASVTHLLEIGPHSALQGPIRQTLEVASPKVNISYTSALVRGKPANTTLLEAVGKLHCSGFNVDLVKANGLTNLSERISLEVLPALPEYPFDHTQTYWSEPRVSRNLRSQPQPYSEYLGVPAADWNPLEPRWHNSIGASSILWVRDHRINGEILYPAAGMWVMAVEAITQISTGKDIVGYEIRDTAIMSSLVLPSDGTKVEVQFRLKPAFDSSNKTSAWADFSLYACRSENNIFEICHGSIKAVFASSDGKPDANLTLINQSEEAISLAKASYASQIDCKELYVELAENGYHYGSLFQGIQFACRNSNGQVVGDILVRNPPSSSSIPTTHLSAIHPCDLDSVLQLCLAAICQDTTGRNGKRGTWVPTYLSKLWLPSSGFRQRGQIQVHASTQFRSTRLCSSSIQAVSSCSDGSNGGVLQISGAELTLISSQPLGQAQPASRLSRRLCYDLVHAPDITLLPPLEIAHHLRTQAPLQPDPTTVLRALKLYNLCSLSRAVAAVPYPPVLSSHPHLQKQHLWAQSVLASAASRPPLGIPQNWKTYLEGPQFETLASQLSSMSRLGELHVNFGRHIPSILRGETDPLQALGIRHDGDEEGWLAELRALLLNEAAAFAPMARYLDLLAHKNPGMRVLEVGAGVGAATKELLKTLVSEQGGMCRFASYDFTDSSSVLLERARREREFEGLGTRMNFAVLDVERDAVEQGFEEGRYDLCVAVHALRGAKRLRESLVNIRRLLKEDGKLVLMEITDPYSTISPFIFGFLPGWWTSAEAWRQNGPVASISEWDQELKASGFDGAEVTVPIYQEEENQFASLIISSATRTIAGENKVPSLISHWHPKTAVVIASWSEKPSKPSVMAELVLSKLRRETDAVANVQITTFLELAAREDLGDDLVIVVHDLNTKWPSLAHLTKEEYEPFHSTFSRACSVLWLASTSSREAIGPVQGLARTLRRERHGFVFSTVEVDPATICSSLFTHISIAVENFLRGAATGMCEWELTQNASSLTIPRVYESPSLDDAIFQYTAAASGSPILSPCHPFSSPSHNVKLAIRQPGLLDTLYFTSSSLPSSPLPPKHISVSVKSIGINFRDCLIALGRVDQDTLGSECSGIVLGVGSEVTSLQPGDSVLVFTCDSFQSVISCDARLAVKMPSGMTFPDAASIPTNFVTAYHALVHVARLATGESVLIQSGAGGTGQAAVQVAKWCGAEIYTTVGSEAKRKLMVDSLAGDALVAGWECVAPYGRFVEIGKRDIFEHGKLPMFQFAKNVSFCAVDLSALTVDRPQTIQEELSAVMELFEKGILRLPEPMKAFPIREVETAFRYLQSGKNAGKVVVEVGEGDCVPNPKANLVSYQKAVVQPKKSDWTFSPDGTFIIAGGLGAMGRIIAKWMVTKGARHLVLLSRSGLQHDNSTTADFVRDLQSRGANLYCPSCNIADAASLRQALEYCREHMPPIKGCIQAAMVLRDGLFENMDHTDWSASLNPKVHGSWNLHEQLPRNLDFFILCSSVAGIVGSQGQANYAAGNTYQDWLARYRVHQLGERALSINLSLVQGDGFSVEHPELAQQMILTKHVVEMSAAEMLGLLDHICSPAVVNGPPGRSQIIMGLDIPSHALARGMDPPGWMHEPMFANLHQLEMIEAEDEGGQLEGLNFHGAVKGQTGPDVATRVKEAASVAESADIVCDALLSKLCKALARAPESLDKTQPLHVYGVDSLVAVELRNWILQTLKVDVAVFEILGGSTCATIARGVAEKVRLGGGV